MLQAGKNILRAFLLLFALLLSMSSVFSQGTADVRFVHVVPDAPAVDVYINGSLTVTGLSYGEASNYVQVPAGDHSVSVTAQGSSTPLWEQSISAADGSSTTFIASSLENARFDAFSDDRSTTPFGGTRLLLVHALAGGAAVDVQLAEPIVLNGVEQAAGTVIASEMAYGTSFGSFDLPAQTYVVNVVPSGGTGFDALLPELTLPLNNGTSYMAIVYGTSDNPQALLLGAPTTAEAGSGLVRFAHAVVGAPAVDVFVNDTLLAPQLSVAQATAHMALPAGTHTLELRIAGTEETVASGEITVEADTAQTAVALPGDDVTLGVFPDDTKGATESSATVSVINAVPDSTATLSLVDGTSLGSDLAFGAASAANTVAPTVSRIDYSLTIADATGDLQSDEIPFYGGVYYNVIVIAGDTFSGPRLLVAETALAQGLASAPAVGTVVASEDPGTDVSEDTAPEVAQQSTPEPVTVSSDEDTVTARVLLDPSANLQLRQYPSTEALSLGLAPSGTTLIVNGREGRPVALVEGQDPPPEAEDFVDPATQLADETEDLDPAETWLNVIYSTPDGGQITAWVLAQYVEVRDGEGNLQRLAGLPTVPNNLPGEALDTELTPPPIPEDRVTAVVFNLNPDTRLNVRRTPTTAGEVLTRLPNDTVVEFIGFPEPAEGETFDPDAVEWVFVSYTPAEGGVVTGWVSTLYVFYQWNGSDISIEELQQRDLIAFVDPERVGEISGATPQVNVPTPDPLEDAYVAEVLLDPGANLQFRRSPDAQSESLNLIPSGTQLVIEARTADSEWLRTTFEGEAGWVSAAFVLVRFNGAVVDIEEIPVEADTTPDDSDQSNG